MYDQIQSIPSLNENLSLRDVQDTVGSVCIQLQKNLKDIQSGEFSQYIQRNLLRLRRYKFYYPVYQLFSFPEKYQIGDAESIHFDHMPDVVRSDFKQGWEWGFKIDTEYARTAEELFSRKKDCLMLSFTIEALAGFKALEKARKIAEESFNLIRFSHGAYFPILDCKYHIDGSKTTGGEHGYGKTFHGSANYSPSDDRFLEPLTEIIRKGKAVSDTENRIRNAVNVFGIQTSVSYPDVKLILLIAALEALLLSKSDRDYLGWKLAERTSFLLGKSKKPREKIYEFITEVYDKRSSFAHQKTKHRKGVTDSDIRNLEMLLERTVLEVLKLRDSGYMQLQKDKEKPKTIIGHIDELKFS